MTKLSEGWNPRRIWRAGYIDSNLAYLEHNRPHMHYDLYRSQGLFIDSGIIEADCKTVVTQRAKLSGMLWGEKSVQDVLTLCYKAGNRHVCRVRVPPSMRSRFRFQSRSAIPPLRFRGGTPSRGSRGFASASSAPKGRHPFCLFSPEGAPSLSPGQRPGCRAYPRFSAPKGRHSWPRGAHGLSVCRPGRAPSRFGFHSQGAALG